MTSKILNSNSDARVWEAQWEGHERAQMKRFAKLTLEKKIRWLESAQELINNMQRLNRKNGPS